MSDSGGGKGSSNDRQGTVGEESQVKSVSSALVIFLAVSLVATPLAGIAGGGVPVDSHAESVSSAGVDDKPPDHLGMGMPPIEGVSEILSDQTTTTDWGNCVAPGSKTGLAEGFAIRFACTHLEDDPFDDVDESAAVAIQMRYGWTYVVNVMEPSDTDENGVILENDRQIIGLADMANQEVRGWFLNQLPIEVIPDSNEVSIIGTEVSYATDGGLTTFFPSQQIGETFQFHPGVYEVEAWAFPPYETSLEGANAMIENYGEQVFGEALRRSDTKHSTLTLEVGGCEAGFPAVERLNDLDRRWLEGISQFFDAKRLFEEQKVDASFTVFLGVAGNLALEVSGADEAKRIPDPGWEDLAGLALPTPMDMKEEVDKAFEMSDLLRHANDRLLDIEQDREGLRTELERCAGGNYQLPENQPEYDQVSPHDLWEAKQPDGDTIKDES